MTQHAIPGAVLMCHAPIVLPAIAGPDAPRVSQTTRAMEEVAAEVIALAPDAVVIASPHAPRHHAAWLVASDPDMRGDFGRFGAPEVGARVPFGAEAALAIERAARDRDLACAQHPLGPLDHGTLVPLSFLVDAGWAGPTVRLALPMQPSRHGCEVMGRAIAAAARSLDQRWALVASGDMSHRLAPGAPAGFCPQARNFDAAVVRCVERGDYAAVARIDPELREEAAEDVIDTLELAAAAVNGDSRGHRILSYEGPFGVGYLVAVLHGHS